MPSFTNTFGGTVVYPADVSYRAIALTANVTLTWPTELATNTNVVASIMDVTPSGAGLTIRMPDASQASVGQTALFFNVGASSFTVADNSGNTIQTIASGQAWQIYLTGNATVNGTWRPIQYGAGTSSASASALAGAGLKAITTTLNQSAPTTLLSADYTLTSVDRARVIVWNGGAGTFTMPSAATAGNDWFFDARNSGTGGLTIQPAGGELINGQANLVFNPGDSARIITDGINFYTIGYGQSATFSFDYVSISLTGQPSPYTLSGTNLNRIAYQFSGILTANMEIIVPNTIQQYWIRNTTTGSYTLTVKTSGGTGVVVVQNGASILYCDGTNVVQAETANLSVPVAIAQGGTGATNAGSALVNLGGTSLGIGIFTATNGATARASIGAASSGANSDITSLSGLTTPLSVPQGGTGLTTTPSNGRLLIGNGTNYTLANLTAGAGLSITNGAGSITIDSTGVTAYPGAGIAYSTGTAWGTSYTTSGTGTTIALSASPALTGTPTAPTAAAGTNTTQIATTAYVVGTAFSSALPGQGGNAGKFVTTDGTTASWSFVPLTSGVSGILPIANGGTNASDAATALTNLGAYPASNPSGFTSNTGTVTSVSGTGTVNGITLTGSVTTSGSLTLGGTLSGVDLTSQVTGTLPVANGGTGATTLTANNVLLGNGTSAVQVVAPGTSGNILTSNGTTWTSAAAPVSAVSYPQNIQSGNYTLVLADAGKHIYSANTGAQTITIPANASVAFPIGTVITIVNQGTTSILLSGAGVSIFPEGSAVAVTSPVVPAGSTGQLVKVDTNSWEAIVGVVQANLVNYVALSGGASNSGSSITGCAGGGFVTGAANFELGVLTITVGALGAAGGLGNPSSISGSTTITARQFSNARSTSSIPEGLNGYIWDGVGSNIVSGGGGGGAGGAGGNGTGNEGGKGGIGALSTITGSPVYYGAGGAGVFAPSVGGSGEGSIVILSVPLSEYSGTRTGSPAIVRAGNNAVLTFTSSGTYTAAVGGGIFYSADMLVVAGGGGGGNPSHGGGGAGGYVTPATQTLFRGLTYAVTVGSGGAGSSSNSNPGTGGNNSTVAALSITALGGGGGGSQNSQNGQQGGSGGGGATNFSGFAGTGGVATQPTSASGGFGNAGGNATGATNTGAGGGGAGGAGASSAAGGAGGIGLASSITGTSVTRAVGGARSSGTAGPANTGNGGGGAAASGGSGVVIISIPTAFYTGTTTGSPVVTTSGSNTILQFNSSGSYTA